MDNLHHYRTLSPTKLWHLGSRQEKVIIFGGWLALVLASIELGLLSVMKSWSGLPLSVGGVNIYITLYPPLLICLFLTLTCGWRWGAVPAYLSTLALALYSGMPWYWAVVFACANPLGFAIMAVGYQAIPVKKDLRDSNSLLFYIHLSFVASIFSSSGALIWCYTNHIDRTALLAIWQGWWLGSFLQSVFIIGPLLAFVWPAIARWQNNHPDYLQAASGNVRRSVLRFLGAIAGGVLIYGVATIQLATNQLDRVLIDANSALGHAITVMQQTTWVFFWVFVMIILFIAFFGYQLFTRWQQSTNELLEELHRANQSLEHLAQTDGLTGLLNRRTMDERLHSEWLRAARMNHKGALVILDIDHFKSINDRYGHPVGDAVIRTIAQAIQAEAREMDIASRYGGEEFMILLPQTEITGAIQFAERIRHRIATIESYHEVKELQATISVGVAIFDHRDTSYNDWVTRADQALYRAKDTGRNRVVIAGHTK